MARKYLSPPFLYWQTVLRNTRQAAEEGRLIDLPHFWLTARNEPRCVRCGVKLTAEEARCLYDAGAYLRVGACSDCAAEVVAELSA